MIEVHIVVVVGVLLLAGGLFAALIVSRELDEERMDSAKRSRRSLEQDLEWLTSSRDCLRDNLNGSHAEARHLRETLTAVDETVPALRATFPNMNHRGETLGVDWAELREFAEAQRERTALRVHDAKAVRLKSNLLREAGR